MNYRYYSVGLIHFNTRARGAPGPGPSTVNLCALYFNKHFPVELLVTRRRCP
jgi:hypothetical protein